MIVPKSKIIARSPLRKIALVNGRDFASLKLDVEKILRQCRWTRVGDKWISRSHHTYEFLDTSEYLARVALTIDTSGGGFKIRVDDHQSKLDFTALDLRLTGADEYYILGSSYQLIIAPKGSTSGNLHHILISSIRIPSFVRDNPFIAGIVACEAGNLFLQWNNLFGNTACGLVDTTGSVFQWINTGGNGIAQFFPMGVDNIFAVAGAMKIKSPAWIAWGTGSNNDVARLQGFLWDLIFVYRNDIELHTRIDIDRWLHFHFNPVLFNNAILFEYARNLPTV